ncbi:MAG: alpha-glucosidase/alpha-galactosidase [Phycisphaerales bacterium]|nr:alpha-glucosidase/alpha-galactosidase [Phycisphaerales bacterium]
MRGSTSTRLRSTMQAMIKIAMIGAGSVVFSRNLTGDILSFPQLRQVHFSYMDIDPERLNLAEALCRKVANGLGAEPRVQATTDLRTALDGADFVINMVQIGGFDSTLIDFEIPRKYGLKFTIADTTGPGGLFRALRTYPMLRRLCDTMQTVCPRAILLNYSNPMSMNMLSITRTSDLRAVGLCHSVQGTFRQLMSYLEQEPESVAFICAGINHMAFFLRIERNGVDLYPRLFEAMNRPEIYDRDRVRFEIMRRLGYFVTESSEHNAEYCPWFIPHGPESIQRFKVPIDEYLRRCEAILEEYDRLREQARSTRPMLHERTEEYGSAIIHSMVTGKPCVVYGNMPNRGAITNLPSDAIAEAPALVDRNGPAFTLVGALPPQLLAYVNPHIAQQELFIRAATEGRRDHVYQAAMFDPLTASMLPPDRIVELCDELIAAHGLEKDGGLLPDLDARRTLVPTSGRSFDRIDVQALRAGWQAKREPTQDEPICDWYVIGPFPAEPGRVSLKQKTAIDEERAHGAIDLTASHLLGSHTLIWKKVRAGRHGFVDCDQVLGACQHAIAYGYAELHSTLPRDTVLKIGSDDGIAVWLNGRLVHENDTRRAFRPGDDEAPVHLHAGVNRILVKITQFSGGWGWAVALPRARS